MTVRMDSVFKALADPGRRALLDALREEDGQTLTELEGVLDLSRFGVAKHLKALEAAGLVTRVKRGRFTHHYLNAVPLAEALLRWIEPFKTAPAVGAVLQLKERLETAMPLDDGTKPDFVLSTYVRCTRDALWDALTKADTVTRYHFAGITAEGDKTAPGAAQVMRGPDGSVMLTETVTDIAPKDRIAFDFTPGWYEDPVTSRAVFHLSGAGEAQRLTIEHYGSVPRDGDVADGWARFASNLKSWLETGETVVGSMMQEPAT
ncbi:MAG: ArsR/SmtB family transcription factor [Hasllibacter sp.]